MRFAPPTSPRLSPGWTPSYHGSACRNFGCTHSTVARRRGNRWCRWKSSAAVLLRYAVTEIHLGLHLVEDPVSPTAADQQPRDPAGAGPGNVVFPAGQAPSAEQQGAHNCVVDGVAL